MAADTGTGMEKPDMKKLLVKSKQEPVNAAFALGKDATTALLLLDRIKQPKAVSQALEKQFPDAKNTRWGTAFVDVDDNPKLVKFTVNKPVSSVARRLAKTLKGTGFTKVIIVLEEDGSVIESHDDEAEDAQPGVPTPPAPPPAQAETADPHALAQALAVLIPRVATVQDASAKARLAKLATDANVAIKTGNLTYAAQHIADLRAALDALSPPGVAAEKVVAGAPPPQASALGPVAMAKASQLWRTCRGQLQARVGELKDAIVVAFADQPDVAAALRNETGRLDIVFEKLDERLCDTLDEAIQTSDPNERKRLVSKAHAILDGYIAEIESEELIAGMDDNPFGVAVNFRETASKVLAALSDMTRAA